MSEKFSVQFTTTSGHQVQVVIGLFWEDPSWSDLAFNQYTGKQFHAVRVYTTEDTLPRRLELRHEFRAGPDYQLEIRGNLSRWLVSIAKDCRQGDYDSVEEFLENLASVMERMALETDNLVSHLDDPNIEIDPALFGFESDDIPEDTDR